MVVANAAHPWYLRIVVPSNRQVVLVEALVSMNSEGRLTVPASARRELGLDGPATFQAEIRDGVLMLSPAVVIPRNDA